MSDNESTMVQDILKRLETQRDEYRTLLEVAKAFKAIPNVVDDDYPEGRHRYESALRRFIAAMKANGRTM